jgi:hypothetical protein
MTRPQSAAIVAREVPQRIQRRRGRYRLRSKPLLTRDDARVLRVVYDQYWRHNYDKSTYPSHAASDALDGLAIPSEVVGLVKKRILIRIQMERCDWRYLGGEHVRCTWGLSPYGLLLMRRWRSMEIANV